MAAVGFALMQMVKGNNPPEKKQKRKKKEQKPPSIPLRSRAPRNSLDFTTALKEAREGQRCLFINIKPMKVVDIRDQWSLLNCKKIKSILNIAAGS